MLGAEDIAAPAGGGFYRVVPTGFIGGSRFRFLKVRREDAYVWLPSPPAESCNFSKEDADTRLRTKYPLWKKRR